MQNRAVRRGGFRMGPFALMDLVGLDVGLAVAKSFYEQSFGDATGHLFLVSVPFALAALVCILFIREVPLRTTLDVEDTTTTATSTAAGATDVEQASRA